MTKDELIERLAEIEHTRWADWQKYLHSKCSSFEGSAGELVIPAGYVESLERQIATPYADLSEREKQSDREQVMRYWPVLREFVAEWIEEGLRSPGFPERDLAEWWREETEAGAPRLKPGAPRLKPGAPRLKP